MGSLRSRLVCLKQKTPKILVVLFCYLLASVFLFTTQAIAAQPITVTFDGRTLAMDVLPVVRDGRVLVPFRAIFNALGAEPHWDAATGQITAFRSVSGESRAVLLYINSRIAWIGNSVHSIITNFQREQITLDTPPVLIGGRTMVPLRFIAENFDVAVSWHPEDRTVRMLTKTLPPLDGPPSQPQPTTPPLVPQRQKLSSGEVTARVMPAVVRIDTHRGQGSGFFVSPEGLVLTNAHVVRGSRQIVVVTRAGERFSATITKIANWHDLALLMVNAPSHVRFPFLNDNPAAGDIPQGEEVLAFGSPLGLTATVTRGIISAWREIDVTFGVWANNSIRVLQHDAAIAPGNSGGPLVNLYGEWVGINTLVRADWAGFGFAVPAERYHALLRQGYYSLRYDWFSYLTESRSWDVDMAKIYEVFDKVIKFTSTQDRIEILNRVISDLRKLQQEVSTYQPIYQEIHDMHQLRINWIDAEIDHVLYLRDGLIYPAFWSQGTIDILQDNALRAHDVYRFARNTLNARFR